MYELEGHHGLEEWGTPADFSHTSQFLPYDSFLSSNEPLLSHLDDPVDGLSFEDSQHPNHGMKFSEPFEISHIRRSDAAMHMVEDTSSGTVSSIESPHDSNKDTETNDPEGSMHGDDDEDMLDGAAMDSHLSFNKDIWGTGQPHSEREDHNALERMRRVNIRKCFENLQNSIPELRAKKAHSLMVLQEAAKYIQRLRAQELEIESARNDLIKRNQELRMMLTRPSSHHPK